jgi:hypothetical protein
MVSETGADKLSGFPRVFAHAISGRWYAQTIYTATRLGVFDKLSKTEIKSVDQLAKEVNAYPGYLYRVLRAIADIGLVTETAYREFSVTNDGAFLQSDHPLSLRNACLVEQPEHAMVWNHLSDSVINGPSSKTGFEIEYGTPWETYLQTHAEYASVFHRAMSSYTRNEAQAIAAVYKTELPHAEVICDIGGSFGTLLEAIIGAAPETKEAIVLELPSAVKEAAENPELEELRKKVKFVAGDMFKDSIKADAYFLKHILHDWDQEHCLKILQQARKGAEPGARIYICEMVVPGPGIADLSKIMDLNMLIINKGEEKTLPEYAKLLSSSGWKLEEMYRTPGPISIVSGVAV